MFDLKNCGCCALEAMPCRFREAEGSREVVQIMCIFIVGGYYVQFIPAWRLIFIYQYFARTGGRRWFRDMVCFYKTCLNGSQFETLEKRYKAEINTSAAAD